MNYRFLNVYEAMRIDGLKNFDPPKILFPQGTQVTTISKNSTLPMTEEEYLDLKADIEKEGKGAIKIIMEFRNDLLVVTKPEIKEEVKLSTDQTIIKAQDNVNKIVYTAEEMMREKKRYSDAAIVVNVALKQLYKTVSDSKLEIDRLNTQIKRKNEKIKKLRSGEIMTLESVAKSMTEFNLFSKDEVDKLIDFHVNETIKSEGIFSENLAILNEQKIVNRYEIEISKNNVKKLVKLIDPKPAKEIKYSIALMNSMNIATVNSYKDYTGVIKKIIQIAHININEVPKDMREGLNVIYLKYKNENNKRPILIMKYHSVSREKFSQEREKNIQSTLENTKLYKENMEHRKKEEIYNITADRLKKNLKTANEVEKDKKYGVSLTNKMGMFSSQTFKEYKEVIFFIYEATGALKNSIPTMRQLMYDENVIPIKYGGEEIYRPIIIRKY